MMLTDNSKKNDVSAMEIGLAKTFLEIAETGSFVAAAARLNVTQTAVSARVRTLEEQIGCRLFVRNKSGARLTPAGERFVRHARMLVQVWDRARLQAGLPEERADIASIGAEVSLWNSILVDWLAWMKREAPDIALRAEVDKPARLLEAINNGSLDLAVVYEPPPQPGNIIVELLAEEKLVLLSTSANGTDDGGEYVHVDWGAALNASQQAVFSGFSGPGVSISYGPLALLYVLRTGGCGYFRSSEARPHVEAGRLHPVVDAPEFSYSMHVVYSGRIESGLIDRMRRGLRLAAGSATAR